jgi:hypothetical protein
MSIESVIIILYNKKYDVNLSSRAENTVRNRDHRHKCINYRHKCHKCINVRPDDSVNLWFTIYSISLSTYTNGLPVVDQLLITSVKIVNYVIDSWILKSLTKQLMTLPLQ